MDPKKVYRNAQKSALPFVGISIVILLRQLLIVCVDVIYKMFLYHAIMEDETWIWYVICETKINPWNGPYSLIQNAEKCCTPCQQGKLW